MHLLTLLFIIFCHTSLVFSQFPYPNQEFKLPRHSSNWICTVHVTVATFANYTSSDITERFLTSNQERIITTLSTMHNRSLRIVPVISFFEPCTISILVDALVNGSSFIGKPLQIDTYIRANEYTSQGWRHSIMIVFSFSCNVSISSRSYNLPHRLFYHILDCGPQNTFPNHVFLPDSLRALRTITDPTHNIHNRKLPIGVTELISRPKYRWDQHNPSVDLEVCSRSRWVKLSAMHLCTVGKFAVYHYEHFLNFTTAAYAPYKQRNYGDIITGQRVTHGTGTKSITIHAIDSANDRVIYCDHSLDSPRFRPINLLDPVSFEAWITFVVILILCAISSSFTVFDLKSIANSLTVVTFCKRVFNSLFVLIISLLEQDLGKRHCIKIFVGLIGICLSNTYKNYLTIDLVFPRTQDVIQNVTELLDLNFNILQISYVDFGKDKSSWLKEHYVHLEIDKFKREKYVREANRWLKFIPRSAEIVEIILNEVANNTGKTALLHSAP
jgi:hypothetical protein